MLAAAALALTACSVLQEDGGEKSIRINLPPIVSASGNSRSISDDRIPTLKGEVRRYRVTVNGMTREGTGSSYEFTLPVGMRATVIVECLNKDGDVIIRAVKDFTVAGGDNNIDINLKADGNEIIPQPPAPPPSVKSAVSYELDGGDWSSTSAPPQTEEYDEGATVTITTNVPTKQGFTFLGWKSSVSSLVPSGGGDNFQAGSTFTMPSSAVTFTAQWTSLPTHTVTYDLGFDPSSGSRTSTAQVPEGAAVSLTAPSVERKGYEFKYWMNGQSQAPSGLTMGNSDITLVADWNVITYTITYNPDGGTVNPSSDTFDVTTGTINFPQANGKTGYSFDYWKAANGTNVTGMGGEQLAALVPSGSTTLALTAVWREETYNITYTVDNGEGTGTVSATFTITQNGGQVTLNGGTAGFTRSGYRIASWKYDDGSSAGNAGAQVAASALITKAGGSTSLQLTAVWTPITYTITYNANGGGNNPASTTFTVADSSVTFASFNTLAKTGYTCMGWETTDGTDVANMFMPTEIINLMGSGTTLALRAKWEIRYKSNKSDWEVGDIVLNNSSGYVLAIHPDVYTARDATTYGNGVAVVYKNDSLNSKVYIVGKVHEKNGLEWCLDTAKGYDKIGALVTEMDNSTTGQLTFKTGTYTDGSTGLAVIQALGDYDQTNYPAWYWANNYGSTQSLTGDLANNWYLPSLAEVFDIWKANNGSNVIKNALTAVGGDWIDDYYWSSSQIADLDNNAYKLDFSNGGWYDDSKFITQTYYACAVRTFTY